MEDKIILKALHRVLSEKCIELEKIIKEIHILNHQTESYNRMRDEIKEEVIENLFSKMKKYGWNEWVKEIKEGSI